MRNVCLSFLLIFFLSSVCLADDAAKFRPHPYDWPQWQGPERTAISQEKGLLTHWPKTGPRQVWKIADLGGGYSGPSVAAGRLFGMSYRGEDEVVWALDESDGKELWATKIAKANRKIGSPGKEGSRCTPTVDGDRAFALGVSGDLVCLEVSSGKLIWGRNLVKDFGGRIPNWGYSESPLVDGDKVLATPGGKSTIVAFDKKGGETLWESHVPAGNGVTYSSIIVGDVDGLRQYMQLLNGGVAGIAADDGRFLWRFPEPGNGISCSTPLYHDHLVFAASSYGVGGGAARLTRDGSATEAKKEYFTKQMKNHHGGMVLVDGYLYGANDPRFLVCLEYKTGKVKWSSDKPGKGSIAWADGHLYYRNEGGPVLLIEANPEKYVEVGRFQQPDRSGQAAWPHPVVANGKLYIRDQDILLCYDVKQPD